jgi:molybdenum cofactor guanylyltransferase
MTALAGLVLCGGSSSRMGSDKTMIQVGGRPLVVAVAETVSEAAWPVFLAPGRRGRLGDLGYPEVDDEIPGAGPLGAVVAGLLASPHPLMAVAGGDMPFASSALFSLMAKIHSGEDAVVPISDSGPEPLHAVYARDALPRIRSALAEGLLSMRGMLDQLTVRPVEATEWRKVDPSGRFALNLNSPEDLSHLEPR